MINTDGAMITSTCNSIKLTQFNRFGDYIDNTYRPAITQPMIGDFPNHWNGPGPGSYWQDFLGRQPLIDCYPSITFEDLIKKTLEQGMTVSKKKEDTIRLKSVDIEKNEYVVEAQACGYGPEDIKVLLTKNGVMTVTLNNEEQGETIRTIELEQHLFMQTATCKHGLLKIVLKKIMIEDQTISVK